MSIVLDPATMAKALTRLSAAINNGGAWKAVKKGPQERFLKWYDANRDAVERLSGLITEASNDASVLNKFLTDNGFNPQFREIEEGCYGAAAILDMLVNWKVSPTITQVTTYENAEERRYPAFHVPSQGIDVFKASGRHDMLVRLNATNGSAVWIIMTDQPEHELDLLDLAQNAMKTKLSANHPMIDGAIVPMVDIETTVPLEWMLGVTHGDHYLSQAFQAFRLRMNEKGVRAKTTRGISLEEKPEPIIFDRPFAGWLTQPGSELPTALFYATPDSWKDEGSLNEL